jgi:beta-N-acetylhexosaminidase
MKKGNKMKKLNILIMLLVLLTLVGCNETNKKQKEDEKEVEESKEEIVNEVDKKVEETLKNMTLDEKIGQLMIVFYTKDEMDNTLKSALNDVQPGGFILFKDNITTYEKTLNFIKDIKSNVKIPMFMSIDQEGGNVQRLKSLKYLEVSDIPYMSYVGKLDDEQTTYNLGKLIAEELRVFGINMDFAPVIDVYSNPNNTIIGKRAFGSTSKLVSKHGLKLAKGLEDNGVIAVYKHFPGHGNTEVDSHKDLPIVSKTKEELMNLDLIPFIDAINNNANVIMVGHLAVPNITNDNTPASLSKKLITDFLKEELNYSGLVVTDALNMKALTNYYTDEEICGKAVEAGVDILLMPSSSRKCLKSVKDAIDKGIITEERINESVRKILKLKYEKLKDEYLDKSYLNNKEHQEIIEKIKKML